MKSHQFTLIRVDFLLKDARRNLVEWNKLRHFEGITKDHDYVSLPHKRP